jgi:Ca2+-binding RTX toxin-like protein
MDRLSGGGQRDALYGLRGEDVLDGGPGPDWLDGGDGTDTASYLSTSGSIGVTVKVGVLDSQGKPVAQNTVGAGRDTLVSIENLIGSPYGDKLVGDDGPNVLEGRGEQDELRGGGGSDTLKGGAARDTLWGNSGDDILEGGAGNDILRGGPDADTADYSSASARVVVYLGKTEPQDTGGAGVDTLDAGDIENLTGSDSDIGDVLFGSEVGNTIRGGDGADSISGRGGSDILIGGRGADTLTGGAKTDAFVIEKPNPSFGTDKITDFDLGADSRDRIYVLSPNFGAVSPLSGVLPSDNLRLGESALDVDDFFVFNPANATLYFDPDALGQKSKVPLASFQWRGTGTAFSNSDIRLVASVSEIVLASPTS